MKKEEEEKKKIFLTIMIYKVQKEMNFINNICYLYKYGNGTTYNCGNQYENIKLVIKLIYIYILVY
jgi:hypothetical protein